MKRMMNIVSKEGRALSVGVYETREEAIAAFTRELVVEDQQCAECNAAPATRWYEDVTDNDGTGFLQVPVCDNCFRTVLTDRKRGGLTTATRREIMMTHDAEDEDIEFRMIVNADMSSVQIHFPDGWEDETPIFRADAIQDLLNALKPLYEKYSHETFSDTSVEN